MVSIRFRAPGALAVLVLVAAVARSASITLLNDIPVGLVLDEGSTFVLKWDWDGDASIAGKLSLYSFNITDTDSSRIDVLEGQRFFQGVSVSWRDA